MACVLLAVLAARKAFLADGTSIRMDGSTDVGFLRGKAARQVEVKTGMVRCDVAKQPAHHPLVFQTPHAELTVLGTAFDLLAAPAESRARVHQGRVRWTDGGLRFAHLLQAFGEHGLLVTRWTEPVGGDVAIEADVSAVGTWSLGMAVAGDRFESCRIIFVAPKYPHGIAVDSIHPVEATLLAQDPRPIATEQDHTLRVEKRGQQLRVRVDRELRIDTVLAYPLAPDRKRTFALSEFGTGPLIRSLQVWKGGRD